MALATTLYAWLGSADARFETLCSASVNAQSTLLLLDAFFQQATGLQLQREQLKALSREAQTALNEDTRLVFLLYMRVLALLKKQSQQQQQQQQQQQHTQDEVLLLDTKLVDSVLHVTRVVPFCQLYARNNATSVEQLLTELVSHVGGFEASVGKLHDVYLKHLQRLHVSVQQDKRNQVLDLIQSVYEISLSLDGLLASDSMVTPLLLSDGKDPELVLQGETLMRALVVCYESDLPMLQRHLVKLDDKAQDKTLIIAETRRLLLQVLSRFMNLLVKKQDDGNHDEVLLEVLHMISHCCEEENADQGSYLSDLWHLCDYKNKISTFLESGEIESDHLSYLEMIVDGLPRRRIISAGMSSAKPPATVQETGRPGSASDARGGSHAAASAGGFGEHDDEEEKEDPHVASATGGGGEDPVMLRSMVHQVKDFFPDLGDGYIELCLISSQKQLETVINFLLESNPPPALLEVRQDLKRSDPEFAVIEAKLTGKTPAVAAKSAAKPKSEEKLDPTRVWVGKKKQEKHYDPQIVKRDTALAEKTKKIANMIVEEEEIMAGMTPFLKLDEYDDDYNDEFEDYEPFSVHDSGQTDQDTIRQQNRLMLAREAEDAFWESMKNVNHQHPVAHGEEIDEEKEQKETYEFNPNKMRTPVVRGGASSSSGPGPQKQQQGASQAKPPVTTDQKKKNGQQNWKKTAPPPAAGPDTVGAGATTAGATPEKTKEQELRARARSAKNKAKRISPRKPQARRTKTRMTQQLGRSAVERVALRLTQQSARRSMQLALNRSSSSAIATGSRLSDAIAQSRSISTTRAVAAQRQNRSSEATEALLAQQMMDFMALEDEESTDGLKSELPVTGVVMDVKNNIASISGLRHATIGSVVAISGHAVDDADDEKEERGADELLCRGVVLFLEKKVAHVALFSERSKMQAVRLVQPGMTVALESEQLEIPASVAKFVGKAVDPLGELIELVYQSDGGDAAVTGDAVQAGDERISIAWGSKTVPGLMQRGPLKDPLATGIMAIDCFKPLAFGHRFALLGPRNSGKTRVMLDIISHQVKTSLAAGVEPPHFVYVCVGKSQMRVQQILQFLEQTGALPYTTIVSADEKDSLIKQYLAPFSGCAIAEYFMKHKSRKSVVVYDDLATHTTVVENLVLTMKLPRISQLSLSAHEILMERSAPLVDQLGNKSLTTFALADAPDSSLGETTPFQQKMISIVDDAIGLEGQLALQRVYPPVDVLIPGGSIRGPPFQSAALWKYTTKLRALVNNASQTSANVQVAKKLGFEVEPDDLEVLELQELVRQFFIQKPLTEVPEFEREIGVFFLTGVQVRRLPTGLQIWDFLRDVIQLLEADAPELLHLLKTHPRDQPWPQYAEDELMQVFATRLVKLRKERQSQRKRR